MPPLASTALVALGFMHMGLAYYETTEEEQLSLGPQLSKVLHDSAMEAAEPEEERPYFPPELVGQTWEWTSTFPTTPQQKEQEGPSTPPCVGPLPPCVSLDEERMRGWMST